jgi:hypothetical protein
MNIGVGARASAMSNSVLAFSDNSESAFWNPAGLVSSSNIFDISSMHSEYFSGISKYDFLSFSYKPNDSSSIAFSALRLGTDDILNTLELVDQYGNINYDRISKFSVADYGFLFSYSKKTKIQGLNIGANAKFIYRNQGDFASAYGFGFDISGIYVKDNWKFGATLRDASSTFNAWFFNEELLSETFLITGNELPENSVEITAPRLLSGFGRFFKLSGKINFYSEIDLDFTFDGKRNVLIKSNFFNIDPHLGIEISYLKIVYFRIGVGNFAIIPDFDKNVLNVQPTAGIGINYKNFRLDYALTNVGNIGAAPYSNYFSLGYSFDKFNRKLKED